MSKTIISIKNKEEIKEWKIINQSMIKVLL
jgi:hypothetical protein